MEGLNRYAYCWNNPINYNDPTGNEASAYGGGHSPGENGGTQNSSSGYGGDGSGWGGYGSNGNPLTANPEVHGNTNFGPGPYAPVNPNLGGGKPDIAFVNPPVMPKIDVQPKVGPVHPVVIVCILFGILGQTDHYGNDPVDLSAFMPDSEVETSTDSITPTPENTLSPTPDLNPAPSPDKNKGFKDQVKEYTNKSLIKAHKNLNNKISEHVQKIANDPSNLAVNHWSHEINLFAEQLQIVVEEMMVRGL